MKNIFKGLLLSALFVPMLSGCGDNSRTITVHADSFYLNDVVDGEVYLAQGLEVHSFGEAVVCNDKLTFITMKIQDDWTYRNVYQNNLFGCITKYCSTDGVDSYYDTTILPTRYGTRVCFAETQEGLAQSDFDWTKKITGNDLWIRFYRTTSK